MELVTIECTGARVDALRHQRVRLDGGLERGRLETIRRDGADDPVAVAQRHQVRAGSPPVITRLCSIDLWQFRSQSAIWSRATAAMKMTRFDIDVPLVTRVGAVRAEDPGRVLLVLADGAGVVEQRAQRADADRQVGAEQVLAEVVEEDPSHRRLEKRGAAGVAGRVPGILVLLAELHERRRQRRQHDLE